MREKTRHLLQAIERHARLFGIFFQRAALQITELMLNLLQGGNETRAVNILWAWRGHSITELPAADWSFRGHALENATSLNALVEICLRLTARSIPVNQTRD